MTSGLKEQIITSMLVVEKEKPILNDSTFPLRILWEIFECAMEEQIDSSVDMNTVTDCQLEELFSVNFGHFIEFYPAQMTLTPPTNTGE